jgi:hypothetical protein
LLFLEEKIRRERERERERKNGKERREKIRRKLGG